MIGRKTGCAFDVTPRERSRDLIIEADRVFSQGTTMRPEKCVQQGKVILGRGVRRMEKVGS